ncbi:MAG: hypothetical protein JST76_13375 [Bacteroidetes bacterium]|nr:hypothetical protein [Bacteroidota bacterium]
MKTYFRIIFFALSITSCHSGPKLNEGGKVTIHGRYTPPIDHILHNGDSWGDTSLDLHDTISLWFAHYASDCPAWTAASFAGKEDESSDKYYAELNEHSYYIEAAGNNDPLDSIHNVGMTLVFYGHLDTVKRYPKNAHFIDPDPPLGKVFVYAGYKVLDAGRLAGGDSAYDYEVDSLVR